MPRWKPDPEPVPEFDFTRFAWEHYQNPACESYDEFLEDVKRFQYVKRLLNRLEPTEEQRIGGTPEECAAKLINHLITLRNLWGSALPEMLTFKIEPELQPILARFLDGCVKARASCQKMRQTQTPQRTQSL